MASVVSLKQDGQQREEFVIVQIREEHLEQAVEVTGSVQWPHRIQDWRFLLSLGRGFAAVRSVDNKLVGTVMLFPFTDRYATIGILIVRPEVQGHGLGSRLMQTALQDAGTRAIKLYASPVGQKLYSKLGFRPIGTIRHHQTVMTDAVTMPLSTKQLALSEGTILRQMTNEDLETIIRLDTQAAGFNRANMLKAFIELAEGSVLQRDSHIVAWSFCRFYGDGHGVGPVGAYNQMDAKSLISAWVNNYRNQGFLRIDCIVDSEVNDDLSTWLTEDLCFPQIEDIQTITMALGEWPTHAEPTDVSSPKLFALTSLELG